MNLLTSVGRDPQGDSKAVNRTKLGGHILRIIRISRAIVKSIEESFEGNGRVGGLTSARTEALKLRLN
jgi:hypothetical protein